MTDRALLVGIDEYPDPANRLNSCIKDTEVFKEMLGDQFGFRDSEILVLHDAAATLAATREGLDWLFDGAEEGDRRVFFQSSHGYRYPDGDLMTEVLCSYDGFLSDKELVDRSSALPPGVLTVVLDACHSGGMEKEIFVQGVPRTVRNKVFLAPAGQQREKAMALNEVRGVKLFGRTALRDEASLARSLTNLPHPAPPAKGPLTGGLELNAVLFTACRADQTAAAGSAATHWLSAFTYALTTEMDLSISVDALRDRTTDRIEALNMSQTPCVFASSDHQYLLSETFLSAQPETDKGMDLKVEQLLQGIFSAGVGAPSKPSGATGVGVQSTKQTKEKEKEMSTTAYTDDQVKAILEDLLKPSTGAKDVAYPPFDGNWFGDVRLCAAALAPAVAAAYTAAGPGKAPSVDRPLANAAHVDDKSLWDLAAGLAQVVVHELTKAGGPVKAAQPTASEVRRQIADSVPEEIMGHPKFFGLLATLLGTVGPMIVNAITKDYNPADRPAGGSVGVELPAGLSRNEQKAWYNALFDAARVTLPYIVRALG
ncbi:caspase domain-containing protein [Streptomyces sp. NPDC014636]|uniref:caspase family protein n=1 Tax=Streptomyces sp. NPDC014636 TaxID=3364876 RepID=UPI0036F844C8